MVTEKLNTNPASLPLNSAFSTWLLIARVSVGAVWLHEGLWQKILRPDPHELDIVNHFSLLGFSGASLMVFIGALETLLALGFWSGLLPRLTAGTGIVALLSMNLVGIAGGGGTIDDPLGLLIHNSPLWCCMGALAWFGAGKWNLLTLSVKLLPRSESEMTL